MADGNPLVVQAKQDGDGPGPLTAGNGDYGYATGIGVAESAMDAFNGIKDGDWVSGGLGVLSLAGEIAGAAIDPFGYLMSSVASFLMEHVQPLKDMLDSVAGNPPVIQSYADTWGNVAKALQDRQADYTNAVKTGTAEWTGDAADAYRKGAAECAEALGGAATVASAIGTVTMIMGQVVSFVRETVRQLIADLVGKLISWVMEEVFSLGFGTPLVVAQAVTAISKWGEKISGLLTKLCDTMRRVSPLLGKLADVFTKIIKILGKLAGKVTGLDVISTKNIKAGGFAHRTGGGGSGGGSHHSGSDGDGDSPGGEGSDSPDGSGSSHSGDSDADSSHSGEPDSGSSRSGDSDSGSSHSGDSDADGSHSGDGDSASSSPDGGGPSTRDGSSGDSSRRSTGNGTHDGNTGGAGGDNSASTFSGDSPSHSSSAAHSTSGPSGGGSPSHAGSSSSSPSHAGSSTPSGGGSSAPSHTGDAPSAHTGDAPSSSHAGSSPSGGSAPHSTGGSGGGAPTHSGGGSSGSSSPSAHQSSGDSSTSASGYAPPKVDEPAPSAPAPRTGDGGSPSGSTTPNQPVAGGMPPQGVGAPAGSPSGGGPGGTPAARPGSGGGWTGTPGSPGARTPEPAGPRTGPDRGPSSRRPGEGPEPSSRRPDSGSPRRPSDPNTRSPQGPDGPRRPGDPAASGPRRPSDAPEPVARGGSPTATRPEADSPHRTPDGKPGDRTPRHGEPDGGAPHHNEPDDTAPHHDTDGSPDHHDNADHHDNPDDHDPSDHHDNPDHDGGPHHHDDEPLTPDEVNQHHSESTPAGSSYHRGDTDLGDLPHRVQPDPDGRYTVDVHVTADGHARIGDRHYTPEEFADVLRHNADYDGRPIRLIGCDAGSNDFANRLSRELDTDVMAPTRPAWTDSNGRVFSSDYEIGPDGRMRPRIPPDGEWSVHHPDGTSHHAGQDGFAPESHHHDPHDVDADSAHARGDDAAADIPEEEFDLPPATRTYNPDSPEFDRRFVDWDRPDDSEFAGPRHRDGHPDIDSPRDIDDVPARTSNADPNPDGVPQTLHGERPLAGNAEYHVSYENGASTRFYTDADGHVTHVEATSGTSSPNHNPDLRYPLIPGAQYRVPNFHDSAKSWTFHIGENGKPDAMTGDPIFDGRNDTFRDTNSQNRSGGEGKEAFADHPEYGDKYEKVRWAGGHLAANEMGGPGEYVNMHPQMAASNSGNYRDGWIHEASWRNQETELGKFANTEGQDIQNYQVAMHGESNGVPESVTMRWQEVVYKTDANGHVVVENGKPVEISRVTKEREFPNNPADINFGKNRQYSDRSRSR
ncbi:hypothetical protein [Amycolatopsis sp. DSM 110486]|uniref:hypothetical protein n=1 Tax=Amycolatopsis sp. DSM 110486 TaxID=2865832 RepID=UPI001C6993FD|nr:hypothetical protein [Amycolatopsis sp. DSM 110486]QYN22895.1 hypothetical protein K1T34_10760 [Amycolatopsis sp. DSM 110486]